MKRRILSLSLAASMLLAAAGCSEKKETTESKEMTLAPDKIESQSTSESETAPEEKLDYQYGLGTTFHSDEPVTYSMFFSDANWYAMQPEWQSEGLFKKIEELTNVHLDLISYDSSDYMKNITLNISAGESAYIIPKIYDESAFVDGGAIVPISDYVSVENMPNYCDFYNTYNMGPDVRTITKSNGKYYRLPGMLEQCLLNYTFVIRQDIFKAAGVDVAGMEATWTWEDLLEALKTVKAYMVEQGMCKETDYIWSDLWCGNQSGQNNGGNLLKVMGITYNVNAGWAIGNGLRYDEVKDEWYFSPTTDEYKEFLTMAARFVNEGILDPGTFTQDDDTATNQFYNGKTVIMSVNQSQYATYESKCKEILGEGNYELYATIPPRSKLYNYSTAGDVRLENGVMISQKALDELGEDGFIKMLRFVDWLFYSPEAYTLYKWGVEGETFKVNADGSKELLPGYCCGGLGIGAKSEDDIDIRKKWGYAGGNFWYGHSVAEMTDNYIPAVKHFVDANIANRDVQNPAPPVAPTEDENEELTLIITPLIDEVNTWTLSFVTGQKDVEKDWDEFVKVCEEKRCQELVDRYNEIYKASK
ncbi:MAG: extracellular solute-binding protein [Clostridiales bacterium]|nr:extracellular solute-binding protein [Clostridiales bacterium]